jgi:hypothetical protein
LAISTNSAANQTQYFIDGALVATTSGYISSSLATIGNYAPWSNTQVGTMDEVAVFSKTMTDFDIAHDQLIANARQGSLRG